MKSFTFLAALFLAGSAIAAPITRPILHNLIPESASESMRVFPDKRAHSRVVVVKDSSLESREILVGPLDLPIEVEKAYNFNHLEAGKKREA
jgi:hypothetical protein